MKFAQISAKETYHLRQKIMTPGLSLEKTKRPGDDIALHFAIQNHGKGTLGVISVYPETQVGEFSEKIWRIRGMAVDNTMQGKGIGKSLLTQTIQYLRSNYNIAQIWCNSRENATGFYENVGFIKIGEEYVDHQPPGLRMRMELNFP